MADTTSTRKQKCWRKACQWCHDIYPMKKRQRFCSNACSAEYRMWHMSKDQRRQRAAAASAARVAKLQERRFGDLVSRVTADPTCLRDALEQCYQRGYQTGYNKGVDRRDRRRGEAA